MEKQTSVEFRGFGKIPRLNREVWVTEKIDGTNACVVVGEDGSIAAQSRSRLITPEDDNFGFAAWVHDNREDLLTLGPGYHFGEWWGRGIQRNYGLQERKFSLFNTYRWGKAEERPKCCDVVPVIICGTGLGHTVEEALSLLLEHGSYAAPGFLNPEGVIAYHMAGNMYFKATLENDDEPKGNKNNKNGNTSDSSGRKGPKSI